MLAEGHHDGKGGDAPFEAVIQLEGTSVVVELSGEFDTAAAGVFTALTDALKETAGTAFIVDLARVTFMDAAGLAALVHAERHLREQGVRLTVRRAVGRVRWLLDVVLLGHLDPVASPTAHHLAVSTAGASVAGGGGSAVRPLVLVPPLNLVPPHPVQS